MSILKALAWLRNSYKAEKYNADQPRDEKGQFANSVGDSKREQYVKRYDSRKITDIEMSLEKHIKKIGPEKAYQIGHEEIARWTKSQSPGKSGTVKELAFRREIHSVANKLGDWDGQIAIRNAIRNTR